MTTVEEAEQILNAHQLPLTIQNLPLEQSVGKVLQEDLFADRDFPPYNRVTMDGIAINYNSFEAGLRALKIETVAAAGSAQVTLTDASKCIEVMTGAMLPIGADTVIRYEDLQVENNSATIRGEAITRGQNIHYQGEDREKGELIVSKGRIISPAEIGVCATIGKDSICVAALPKAIVISSGDELVEINETPQAHQIRKSNVYRLRSTLNQLGIETDMAHLDDDLEVIKEKLEAILADYQIVILSGGVSKGKFDFIPTALDSLGVRKYFHKIKQRPGKPFWFGINATGCFVFALPGNPVSSFMCMQKYFVPWLFRSLGKKDEQMPMASLSTSVEFKPDMTYFVQVKLTYLASGVLSAIPVEGHGSGDLANLVEADAFLQLPRGKELFEAGEFFPLILFR